MQPLLPYTYVVKEVMPAESADSDDMVVSRVERPGPLLRHLWSQMTWKQCLRQIVAQTHGGEEQLYVRVEPGAGPPGVRFEQLERRATSEVRATVDDQLGAYSMSAQRCEQELVGQFEALRDETAESKKAVMGCLLIASGAREQALGEVMMDASCCERIFPRLPLLGCYAQFEIGPDVTTEVDHGMGGAAPCPTRQDFTAVVLAFVLPDMTSEMANLLPTL